MTERTHEKELNALKADIASLREEIAALVTDVKKVVETNAAEPHVEGAHDAWKDFQHTLGEALAQGEKVVKKLADEIERHPLVGSIAAFGLGFIIAKLRYRGKNNEDHHDDP